MIDKTFILYHRSDKSIERMQQCISSCNEHSIDYIRFQGYSPYNTLEQSLNRVMLEKHVAFPLTKYFCGEFEASIGHFKLWELIALMDRNKAYVVLEDDTIVFNNYTKTIVKDNQVVFLGPRTEEPTSYFYRDDIETEYNTCNKFYGAHAYAIRPSTAKRLIDSVKLKGLYSTVDSILGLRNELDLELVYLDPPPVLCWVRRTNSYIDAAPEMTNSVAYKYFQG